jgi:hypothetical protein
MDSGVEKGTGMMEPKERSGYDFLVSLVAGLRTACALTRRLHRAHAVEQSDFAGTVREAVQEPWPGFDRLFVVEPDAVPEEEDLVGIAKRVYTERALGTPRQTAEARVDEWLREIFGTSRASLEKHPSRGSRQAPKEGTTMAEKARRTKAQPEPTPAEACPYCGSLKGRGTCPCSIECPACHAAPGARCKRPSGHPCTMHTERYRVSEKADAAKCPGFEPVETPEGTGCKHCSELPEDHPARPETIVLYTSAPENYDGFGTRTLAVVGHVGHSRHKEPVRKVAIEKEHLEWQLGRYGSGLHTSTSDDSPLESFTKHGFWVLDEPGTGPAFTTSEPAPLSPEETERLPIVPADPEFAKAVVEARGRGEKGPTGKLTQRDLF